MEKRTIEDFTVLQGIGEGSFGSVRYGIENTTGQCFAIKQLRKSFLVKNKQIENIKREKDNLFLLRGAPHVVELFYTFQDRQYLYFVMEYVPCGDLLSYIQEHGPLPEDLVQKILTQLLLFLQVSHAKNIVHRDLKPDNIMFNEEGDIRVIDFGSSRQLTSSNEKTRDFVGTANYLPPELLCSGGECGLKADIWSIGCIAYQMITGTMPFQGESEYLIFQAIRKIESSPFVVPGEFSCSPSLKELIEKLLSKEEERPELLEIAQHSFMTTKLPNE